MRIGIVIPWFGRDITGGAEQQAWQIAARLAQRGHDVEVLTTCCRSHQDDWSINHLPAGRTEEPEGFAVRRFAVEQRDRAAFDRVCGDLLATPPAMLIPGVSPVAESDGETFVYELIRSAALQEFLRAEQSGYDWFLLLPYVYGPVLRGVAAVGDKAVLQPCLHDEAYAYLPQVAAAFSRAAKLCFNSEGERELALRLFGPSIWEKSIVVGEGVEQDGASAPDDLPQVPSSRYVLYLGRKDEGKNLALLVRAFARFRAARPNSTLDLLLAGHGALDFVERPIGVTDLGLVPEPMKLALLRNCLALVQPSEKESFSRVMMEAWLEGKPVAVHSACLATAVAVQQAGGGWLAATEDEWAALFCEIDRSTPETRNAMGERGRHCAADVSDWEKVLDRYELFLAKPREPSIGAHTAIASQPPIAINQFLPNLDPGDAISNHARWIAAQLRQLGYQSTIFARYIHPSVASECEPFSSEALHASDAIIYHHSIGTEITPHILSYEGPSCLIYHNITPAEFFDPYAPEFADILRDGRAALPALAPRFAISCGVSAYNAYELSASGFVNPDILPICVVPAAESIAPDAEVMRTLHDGRTNLLFVGRIAPQKRQDDLVTAFSHYLDIDPGARLILVGKAQENDPFDAHVRNRISALRLQGSVIMTGPVSSAELAAYYRSAHLFWSMSEHEGFCVPLIEAMWFDVPILAFASSAVPETLGAAGLMFTHKQDLAAVATLAHVIVHDETLRRKIVRAERERRVAFSPAAVEPLLSQIAGRLENLARESSRRELRRAAS